MLVVVVHQSVRSPWALSSRRRVANDFLLTSCVCDVINRVSEGHPVSDGISRCAAAHHPDVTAAYNTALILLSCGLFLGLCGRSHTEVITKVGIRA